MHSWWKVFDLNQRMNETKTMQVDSQNKIVCMFTPAADGGHPLYTAELMTAMARQGSREFKYELVSSVNLETRFQENKPYSVHPVLPVLHHKNSYRSKLRWMLSRVGHYAARELKFLKWLRGRPDIVCVHLQEWKVLLAWPFVRAIQRQGKRVCFTVHNVQPHRYPKYLPKAIFDRFSRAAMRKCDGLFVLSRRLETTLSEFLGEGHPPIVVAPHGMWTVANAAPLASVEERLAAKKLLFFGVIRANKGLHVLLKAAEQLKGYSITIAGEPFERSYVQEQILPQIERLRAMGVEVNLIDRFLADEEVGPLFKSHSAIVLPYTNGFIAQSGVVFMAMAYGLPVVASEAGGLRDLMREARIGLTFEGDSSDALAVAIRSLEEPAVSAMISKGLEQARGHYSWAVAANATIAQYTAVCAERRVEVASNIRPSPAH